jgi:hypothetical protein
MRLPQPAPSNPIPESLRCNTLFASLSGLWRVRLGVQDAGLSRR